MGYIAGRRRRTGAGRTDRGPGRRACRSCGDQKAGGENQRPDRESDRKDHLHHRCHCLVGENGQGRRPRHPDEVNVFKLAFRVPESESRNVGKIFDLARQEATGYEPYARQLAHLFRDQPVVLEELLDILFHIAMADGVMHPAEEEFLEHVARLFGFNKVTYQRIREGHLGRDKRDPYVVLGVEHTASDQDIKSRYRQLIKEHHPDLLMAKGVPEEFIEVANEKLAAINEAYDMIVKERNMN